MDKCFKCDSTIGLSVKYYTKKSREPRYMCNPCRKLYVKPRKYRSNAKQVFDKDNWDRLAKENYLRISEKYANRQTVKV